MDRTRLCGLLFFVGSSQFLVAMMVGEALYPFLNSEPYSVSQNVISDLGVGGTAPLFNSSIILLGVITVAGAYLLSKIFGAKPFSLSVALLGVGAAGVGVFPETLVEHVYFALIAFVFGGVAAILSAGLTAQPFRTLSVILGAADLAALVLYAGSVYLGLGPGGMERMIVYPTLVWGIGFGAYLMGAGADAEKTVSV